MGHLYNAEVKDVVYKKPVYILDKETNKYEVAFRKPELEMSGQKVLSSQDVQPGRQSQTGIPGVWNH